MKKYAIIFLLFLGSIMYAQVGIGTTTPEGALDVVSSTDTGLVMPRVSMIENVTDGNGNPPVEGTMVYDLSRAATCFYINSKWTCMSYDIAGNPVLTDESPPPPPFVTNSTYLKQSNTETNDQFGNGMAVSGDGNTIAIGAVNEASNSTGVNGNESDNSASASGAVYVYVRSGGVWTQQAYIKSSNSQSVDYFGYSVSLNDNGNTLAVSAIFEDSNATGVNGNSADNSMSGSGAVYVFVRSGSVWTEQAYVKASNTEVSDRFGSILDLDSTGNSLIVSAINEDSNATGINGNQADNSTGNSGAVYIFSRSGTVWTQDVYVKASNPDINDQFGISAALSGDGLYAVVGAYREQSSSTGINGNETNNSANAAGAAYVFVKSGGVWSQQAYVKASNTEAIDQFGRAVDISLDGSTVAVGAAEEYSSAIGINGDQSDNSAPGAGAIYVFVRSGTMWSQEVYIKASNSQSSDRFGRNMKLSSDGLTIVSGAYLEDSSATGENGDETDNSNSASGATYIFQKLLGSWTQRSYIKATNTDTGDNFGVILAVNSDGSVVVVSAPFESSNATGVNGDQTNNAAGASGAAYVYEN